VLLLLQQASDHWQPLVEGCEVNAAETQQYVLTVCTDRDV
jgi:hypothetical protein